MNTKERVFKLLLESVESSYKEPKTKVKYSKLTPIGDESSEWDFSICRAFITETGTTKRYNFKILGSDSKELFHSYVYTESDERVHKSKIKRLKALKNALSEFITACEKN